MSRQLGTQPAAKERGGGLSLAKVFGALTLARAYYYTSGLKTTLYSTLLYSILHNLLYLEVLKLETRSHSRLHPMGVPADMYLCMCIYIYIYIYVERERVM